MVGPDPAETLSPTPGRVDVVCVDDRHLEPLAQFYRQTWDAGATAETVHRARAAAAAANPLSPGQPPPTFLLLAGGRALGHVTTIPVRLWAGGAQRAGYWVKGLMVVPDHRNGPVGMLLLREALHHLPLAMAMVVQPAPRRLLHALGFTDLGTIPNHLRLLRPTNLLRHLDSDALGVVAGARHLTRVVRLARRTGLAAAAGATAAAAGAVWSSLLGGVPRSLEVRIDTPLDSAEIDALWQEARRGLAAAPCRDGTYLRARYAAMGDGPYRLVAARAAGALRGVAVVRAPRTESDERLRGIRIATLSDLIFPPDQPHLGRAVIAGAERQAAALSADALLCSATHGVITSLLRRRAFLRLAGNVHFMIRDTEQGRYPPALADWWLTRGDSNADEMF